MKATLIAEGFEPLEVTLVAKGEKAAAPAPTAGPVEVAGILDKQGKAFNSKEYAAGSGFIVTFDVADEEVGAKTLTFGQSGSLGGSMKVVTLEKDGVVIPVSGNRAQNAASIVVNMGNPTAPNNLSPGRWTVKVLFQDAGAAVVLLG